MNTGGSSNTELINVVTNMLPDSVASSFYWYTDGLGTASLGYRYQQAVPLSVPLSLPKMELHQARLKCNVIAAVN